MRNRAPCEKRGRGFAIAAPEAARTRRQASNATAPRATRTRGRPIPARSSSRYPRQLSSSSGSGRLPGGAHRQAAESSTPESERPSPRAADVARFASPTAWRASKRKSPERSPVNIRPVRLAPLAAGARPTIKIRAVESPKAGTGLAQYRCPAKRAGARRAADSRHATSRGHRRQAVSLTSSREGPWGRPSTASAFSSRPSLFRPACGWPRQRRRAGRPRSARCPRPAPSLPSRGHSTYPRPGVTRR